MPKKYLMIDKIQEIDTDTFVGTLEHIVEKMKAIIEKYSGVNHTFNYENCIDSPDYWVLKYQIQETDEQREERLLQQRKAAEEARRRRDEEKEERKGLYEKLKREFEL